MFLFRKPLLSKVQTLCSVKLVEVRQYLLLLQSSPIEEIAKRKLGKGRCLHCLGQMLPF